MTGGARSKTRRKFLSDSVVYSTAELLQRLAGLIVIPVVTGVMGADGYGIYTQVRITLLLAVPVMTLKLPTAMVRDVAAVESDNAFMASFGAGLSTVVGMGILLALPLLMVPDTLADALGKVLFGMAGYETMTRYVGLLLLTSAIASYTSQFYRATHQIKKFSGTKMVAIIVDLALISYFVIGRDDLALAILSLSASRIALIVLPLTEAVWTKGLHSPSMRALRRVLAYSIPLIPNGIMRWGVMFADRMVITHMLGVASVGVYAGGYSIGALVTLLVMPVGIVLLPLVSKLWDTNRREEATSYFRALARFYVTLGIPAVVGVALVGPELLLILSDGTVRVDAILVGLIAAGAALDGVFQIHAYAFHLAKRTGFITATLFPAVGINLLGNLLLVPEIGIHGAAAATMVTYLAMAILSFHWGRRFVKLEISGLQMARCAAAATGMAVVCLWLPFGGITGIIGTIFCGATTYTILVAALGGIHPTDIEFLRRLVGRQRTEEI